MEVAKSLWAVCAELQDVVSTTNTPSTTTVPGLPGIGKSEEVLFVLRGLRDSAAELAAAYPCGREMTLVLSGCSPVEDCRAA
jgi:hypothetical protein